MTVLRFLADFAQLFMTRAAKEGINDLKVVYSEEDGKAYADITGPQGGAITIGVEHPLDGLLDANYTPELTPDLWELFLRQEKPWRFQDVEVQPDAAT